MGSAMYQDGQMGRLFWDLPTLEGPVGVSHPAEQSCEAADTSPVGNRDDLLNDRLDSQGSNLSRRACGEAVSEGRELQTGCYIWVEVS